MVLDGSPYENRAKRKKKTMKTTSLRFELTETKRLASRFSLKGYLEPKWLRYKLEPLLGVADPVKIANLTQSNHRQHDATDRGPAIEGQIM